MKNLYRKVIRLVSALMLGTILSGCTGGNHMKEKIKIIETVESMTITQQGMRGTYVYEIEVEKDRTVLNLFSEVFRDGADVRKLKKSAVVDTATFVALMNSCKAYKWNGFHGEHPKNVLDGIMFQFTASVNGGKSIRADGSANFPDGYKDLVRAIDQMLAESQSE